MSIVEIPIPVRCSHMHIVCEWVVTDFGHGGSILGIDCLKKIRLQDNDPGVLISRALANGSTDFLIYNADTGDRSMVQCASVGEVMMEQNQYNSNEIGGNIGYLTEDWIIEDGIIENGIIENGIIENGIIENGIIENGSVEDRIIEDMIIEDMIVEDREEVINDYREEVVNTSNHIVDRIIEDREEAINESNVPEDGIIENREDSGIESENDPLEPPFPALENRGGQVDSPLRRHSSHILIIQWLEARRRRGLPELDL
ncbi:hypothetical protein BHYA_0126g00310 [Botrytis hyacinthi]|uniref:Uncharacterized protein n=1 Tax=Botrytis hyacinthi TaxID=278943 RepID=A0A4Z1GRZ3_9HELO|nr:hypothetical protein BHYA_0126g00310 [Botrytis hyacinthi]